MIEQSSFRAIGTTHRILATDPATLDEATRLVRVHLDALDRVASRFRADSEISRLARLGATGPSDTVTTRVSPLLADHLRAGIHAGRLSGGLVDITVGSAVAATGYDADLDEVRGRRHIESARAVVPGWRRVHLDPRTDELTLPAGTVIDVGATAKAHAADTVAELVATRLPGGFLINLGGDIATSGVTPQGGWPVAVEGPDGDVRQVVILDGQAMTTSSTQLRTWVTTDGPAHHVVDPRTGTTAPAVWGQVTVVAGSALEANTASTASLVLGAEAPAWLERHRLPARLDGVHGGVVTTAGWPTPSAPLAVAS